MGCTGADFVGVDQRRGGGRSQPAKDGGSGLAGTTCAPEAGLNWIDQHGFNLLLGDQPRACAEPSLVD